MSTTIDQKVVEMRFDNAQFEQGVSQSISSIDNLKSSLDFSGISNSISGLGGTISSINSKLSPFGEMWREIWSNAADVVWSAANSIMSATQSMGIEQFFSGFEKYSLLTKAVQTIMSATRHEWADQAAQMDYVSTALEKLNWFTDETSYSFTDMVGNIGKFTAASIPMDTAVTSMMGIATWAGISGAGIYEASRAMYNLSQAIAMGYVSVKDWMSIENANMATREFKQTVIDTAVELGYLQRNEDGFTYAIKQTKSGIEELEVSVDNFRTTLGDEYGYWFKADVLNVALDEYGGFVEQLYIEVNRLKSNATDVLGLIKDYKKLLVDVAKTSEDLGMSDVDATKKLIQEYYKGTLDLESVAEEYGVTVDELTSHFDKYKGTLLDFNELKTMTDGTVIGAVQLKSALDKLSAEEYELGYSAFLASQESRTLQDAILGIQDAASSSWMRLFVTAMGDYLEATKLWADVYDELWDLFVDDLYNFADVVDEWGELGGREVLIDSLWNTWYAFKDVMTAIKESFKELFPELDGERLYELTEKFRDFTETLGLSDLELLQLRTTVKYLWNIISNVWNNLSVIFNAIRDAFTEIFPKTKPIIQVIYEIARGASKLSDSLKLTDDQAQKIKRTFKGVFAIFDIVGQFLNAVLAPVFKRIGVEVGNLGDGFLDVTSSIGDWLVDLDDAIRETDFFNVAINTLIQFFDDLKNGINDTIFALTGLTSDEIWGGAIKFFDDARQAIGDFFAQFSSSDAENTEAFSLSLVNIFQTLTGWINDIKAAWEEAKPYFDELTATLGDTFDIQIGGSWEDFTEAFRKGGVIAAMFLVAQLLYNVYEYISWIAVDGTKIATEFAANIALMGEAFSETMWNVQKRIKAGVISKIARSLLYLAIAIALIASIKEDKLENAVLTITLMFMELGTAFEVLMKTIDKFEVAEVYVLGQALLKMGLAMAEIAIALAILGKSFDNPKDLEDAAWTLGTVFAAVAAILYVMTKMPDDSIAKLSGISGAMAIIGFALIEFSAALAIIMKVADNSEDLDDAVMAIGEVMAIIATFFIAMTKLNVGAGKMTAASGALAIAGAALIEFASALGIILLFAKDANDAITAAEALSILVGVVGVFFLAMSKLSVNEGTMVAGAFALDLVGFALIEMALALAMISDVASNDSFRTSLDGLLELLVVVCIALIALAKFANGGELIAASGAILIASIGLIALAYALQILGSIGTEGVMDTLFLMAGALTILIVAAMFAEKCVVGLIAMGAALLMIGLGALAAGKGMMLFAAGVNMLVAGGKAGVDVLIYFLEQLGGLIPNFFAAFGAGIVNFLTVMLVDNAAVVQEALTNLFAVLIGAAITILPMLQTLIKMVITDTIDTLTALLPVFLGFLGTVLIQTLLFITGYTPMITAAAIAILIDTLTQIANNIGEITMLLVEILLETIFGTIDGISAELPHIIDSIWVFWISLINAFADGLDDHSQELKDAIIHLCEAVINAVKTFFGINSPSTEFLSIGNDLIQGLINGISEFIGNAKEAITDLADKVLTAVCDFFGIDKPESQQEMLQLGLNIVKGMISGIQKMTGDAIEAITGVADGVINAAKNLLQIESPSKVFIGFGRYIDEGFAIGINKYSDTAIKSSEDMANDTIDAVSGAIASISSIINDEIDTDPTIKPVLDLSDIADGASTLNGMFDGNRTIGLAANTSFGVNSGIAGRNESLSSFERLRATLSGMKTDGGTVNNNYFNITGDDPHAIAEEVSRILQHDVERENAVWD